MSRQDELIGSYAGIDYPSGQYGASQLHPGHKKLKTVLFFHIIILYWRRLFRQDGWILVSSFFADLWTKAESRSKQRKDLTPWISRHLDRTNLVKNPYLHHVHEHSKSSDILCWHNFWHNLSMRAYFLLTFRKKSTVSIIYTFGQFCSKTIVICWSCNQLFIHVISLLELSSSMHKSKTTAVIFLRRGMDGKHMMRFQNENAVFKYLRL